MANTRCYPNEQFLYPRQVALQTRGVELRAEVEAVVPAEPAALRYGNARWGLYMKIKPLGGMKN